MSLTRAGVENEIVTALRGTMANRFFTLSVLVDGANPDLNGPIRRAIRASGNTTADPLTVVDADLAPFTGWDIERLINVAKIETLLTCLGQCTGVDIQTGEDKQYLSQFSAQIRSEIAMLEQRSYGAGVNPAVSSKMTGGGIPNDPFQPCKTRTHRGNWPYDSSGLP